MWITSRWRRWARPSIRPSQRIISTASRSGSRRDGDGFCFFTSPRVRGEVGLRASAREALLQPEPVASLAGGEREMTSSLRFRAAIVSVVLIVAFIGIWHLATRGTGAVATMTPEYAKLMGLTATQGKSAMPVKARSEERRVG